MYPFLYWVDPDGKKYGCPPDGSAVGKFVVKIASHIDYKPYKSEWMCDEQLGTWCLVPDVDLCEFSREFDSQAEAIDFIKNWWKRQA